MTVAETSKDLKKLYKNTEETQQYWQNQWGERDYESMLRYELYNHTFRATVDTFVAQSRIGSGQRVLDIGCGWGRMLIGLLKRYPDLKASGIDISSEAVSRGPALVEQETGVTDIDMRVGQAEELPFADETFDAVVSTRVFQYVNDPQQAMIEAARVLKTGARMTIIVPNKMNPVRYFSYHTQLLTSKNLSDWMTHAGLSVAGTGTVVFCPPRLKRFSEDSWWIGADRLLSRVPGVNRIGGLAWASAVKGANQ